METETMSLTGNHIDVALRSVGAGWGLVMSVDSIAEAFNDAILKYGDGLFNTTDKVAALVSSCMMESAYFRTTEEYNTKDGAYQPYRGRTFIQITWKANYLRFGSWCKSVGLISEDDYFVKNPERLSDLKWAAIGGVWYFTKVLFYGKPLVEYASNIYEVSKAVNLGDPKSRNIPEGQKAREASYKAVRALGSTIIPKRPKPSAPPVTSSKEYIMAVGTEVKHWNNVNQPLVVGEQYVKINKDNDDVSVIVGQNAGVDLVGVVEIDNPFGYPVHAFWRILDWDKTTPKNKENGIAIAAIPSAGRQTVTALFKGDVPKPSADKRSMRLRLVVRVGELPQLKGETQTARQLPIINNVHIDGWKL